MCCRYYIDRGVLDDAVLLVSHSFSPAEAGPPRDVCPGQSAPVIAGQDGSLILTEIKWGFLPQSGKGLLINARAETVLEKRTFRESALRRRCIIPARQFYEWDAGKNKVTFSSGDSSVLYLAGLYEFFGEECRFVILTTRANSSVSPVHSRMPLILERADAEVWIRCPDQSASLLGKVPRALNRFQEYEQLSLFKEE